MAVDLIKVAQDAMRTSEPKQFPAFKAGDTVTVAYKIIEGTKERIQLYRGVVIKIAGDLDKKRFTVALSSITSATLQVRRLASRRSSLAESHRLNPMLLDKRNRENCTMCSSLFLFIGVWGVLIN